MVANRLALLVRLAALIESLIQEELSKADEPAIPMLDPIELVEIEEPIERSQKYEIIRHSFKDRFQEVDIQQIESVEIDITPIADVQSIQDPNVEIRFRKCLVTECYAKANIQTPFCWFHDRQLQETIKVDIIEEDSPLKRSDSFIENLFIKRAKK